MTILQNYDNDDDDDDDDDTESLFLSLSRLAQCSSEFREGNRTSGCLPNTGLAPYPILIRFLATESKFENAWQKHR